MEYMMCILIGKGEGESFKLEPEKEYTVGRHAESDIKILDENVSRKHFKIKVKNDKYFITDLESRNGTFVDGGDLRPGVETEVKEGVPIIIGMTIVGLGPFCDLYLKPFLDSAGFNKVVSMDVEVKRPKRVISIKKNMEFIYRVDDCLTDPKDIKEIFKKLIHNIFNLLTRVDRCVCISINTETGGIEDILYRSKSPLDDPNMAYNKELVNKTLLLNEIVMVKDSNNDHLDDIVTKSLQMMNIRSAMCVPIANNNKIRGVIYVDSFERPDGFRESDAVLLNDVCSRVALAMDNVPIRMS
jgi:pSer/pThr/pTyr-binding forkhead associated (FHA) protein